MGRTIAGIVVILVGLLYLVAVGAAVFLSGDSFNGTSGISMDKLFNALVLLPIGVLAVGAGISLLRGTRR